MSTITDAIRKHLAEREETLYRVAKDTDIKWATLKRFLEGGRLRSDHIDTLADYLGLVLVPASEVKAKPTGKGRKA